MGCKLIDLTGKRFGKLVAIEPTEERRGGSVVWKCQCNCGKTSFVSSRNLISGRTKSCGCIVTKDLTEQKFGRLIVLEDTNKRYGNGSVVWKCQCDCGKITNVSSKHLLSGEVNSCGCLRKELVTKDITGHKFGQLLAIEPTDKRSSRSVVWKCRCDCGKICYVAARNMLSGNTKSCGCLLRKMMMAMKGPLHYGWNEDLTDKERTQGRKIPGYEEWRIQVYQRDEFTCQKCGDNRGGNLNAHHIEAYADNPSLRIELNNGVTLCEKCHKDYHHLYGNHSTRAKFNEWMEQ